MLPSLPDRANEGEQLVVSLRLPPANLYLAFGLNVLVTLVLFQTAANRYSRPSIPSQGGLMKYLLFVLAFLIASPGCAMLSGQPLRTTQTPLDYTELPTPVRTRVESENMDSEIDRIWEIEDSSDLYYQLEFNDGSMQKYGPDGKDFFGGLI